MANTVDTVLGLLKEALELWKTFIATRQEAYNRKMDKRQEAAIRYAEQAFEKISVLYEFIHDNVQIPQTKKAEFDRIKTLIYRLKAKFNKYD